MQRLAQDAGGERSSAFCTCEASKHSISGATPLLANAAAMSSRNGLPFSKTQSLKFVEPQSNEPISGAKSRHS